MAAPSPLRFGSRLMRGLRRASLGRTRQAQIELWQEQAQRGTALGRLMASPEWPVLAALVAELQRGADLETKSLIATHERRLIATAQWCAWQALHRELARAIAEGRRATQKLDEVQRPTMS